ncbi:hypothetical protein HZH66_004619 [Vespula vulgaris]|uniref:Uncharacterized protein n=2 Tax=Vespula TaxID=7451 RepID=A0A834UBL9_VESPE|nr:hypothetical protein HZH66_004619 [Vespula vulgaris]KAF7429165.1 hypothetical protein H0235_005563 [Vespula pensylvanica]
MIKLFYVFANVSSATDEPRAIAISLSVLHKSRNHVSLFSVPLDLTLGIRASSRILIALRVKDRCTLKGVNISIRPWM